MSTKRPKGRPRKNAVRNHLIRYGRLQDEFEAIMMKINCDESKDLLAELLESLKPQNQQKSSD